jgi:chromosomal replication initiator protein
MQIEPVVEIAPPPKLELVFEMPVFQSPAEKILIEVAERHEVTVKDIKSHSHKMKMVHARQEAAYLMQKELKLSLPRIGRVIGKRDHTTILHAIRRYKKRNKIEDNNES